MIVPNFFLSCPPSFVVRVRSRKKIVESSSFGNSSRRALGFGRFLNSVFVCRLIFLLRFLVYDQIPVRTGCSYWPPRPFLERIGDAINLRLPFQ